MTGEPGLDALIAEAVVDAHDDEEQLAGFYAVIEDNLAVPFQTEVLGVAVTMEGIDMLPGSGIVAICRRGPHEQAVGILDLPLPAPRPDGTEWIDAFRRWAG